MVPKKLAGVLLLLALLVLTGCAGEFVSDLYVQDVIDVASGAEEYLLTTGSVIIESPGEEYNAKLKSMLEETFRDVKNFRTGSDDYSSKVIADLKIPVIPLDLIDYEPWNEEPLAVVITPLEEGLTAFGLLLNGEQIDGLFARFMEEAFYTASVQDLSFFIRLNNDLRSIIPVYLQGVYANGVPVHYEEVVEMERRDVIEIKLGDVSRDYAYEAGYVFIGVLEQGQ